MAAKIIPRPGRFGLNDTKSFGARDRLRGRLLSERAYDAVHARALTLYNAENDRQIVLDGTLALLGESPLVPGGAFSAYDEWAGGLRLAASRAAPAAVKHTVRLDEGPVGLAARENRAVYLEGLNDGSGLRVETGLASLKPAALLVCPVQHQGRLMGVLVLGVASRLAERDREFVGRLCAQLAVALHNLGQLDEMSQLPEHEAAVTLTAGCGLERLPHLREAR